MSFAAGCSTTAEKIEDAVDHIGWLEKEAQEWQEAVDFLVDKDRTAARIINGYIADAHYKGEHYREYKEEIYAIRAGIARALGRMKYSASAAALDDFLPTAKGPESMRIEIAWALGEMGNKDVAGALTNVLKDTTESETMKLTASVALCKLDDEAGGDRLVRYLANPNTQYVDMATEGLQEAGHHAVFPLVKALDADTLQIAPKISPILDALCDQLIKQLNDEDKEHRRAAAQALGEIKNKKAIQPLLSLLSDRDGRVRTYAATSLSKMNDKSGMDYLFEALGSQDNIARIEAIQALINAREAVYDRLIESLQNSESMLVRAGAAKVLGENRVQEASRALLGALKDDASAVRWNAIIALRRIGYKEAESHIHELLKKERDPDVIHWGKWALADLEEEK
jgi:HEAT repeat protein